MMNRRVFMGGMGASLGASLTACQVSFDPSEEVGSSEEADTVWQDGSYARFRDNGFLYATHPYTELSYLHVIAAAAGSNWAANNPARFSVILKAMNEVHGGLCGDAARNRYNAKRNWCSEFTRWVYLQTGARDLVSCTGYGRGAPCLLTLSGVTKTWEMIWMFNYHKAYTPAASMTTTSVRPGDYLSLVGSDGPDSHSGLVLGVSANYKWIWTAEGNVGDCVYGSIYPFFQQGALNSRICGVGNIDILY